MSRLYRLSMLYKPLTQFRNLWFLISLLTALACSLAIPFVEAQKLTSQKANISEEQLLGAWYMGTMTGQDCNLVIKANHTLTVQNGGCFHHDQPITSSWTRSEPNQIALGNSALQRQFGPHFRIVNYNGNLVLVPENQEAKVKEHGYVHYFCFWKNMMTNGLQLPKEADNWRKRYLEQVEKQQRRQK